MPKCSGDDPCTPPTLWQSFFGKNLETLHATKAQCPMIRMAAMAAQRKREKEKKKKAQ